MSNKQRDLAKETRWRDILKRHAASGLSVRAFCQLEQVTEPTFYAWRRTISGRDNTDNSPPSFVPAVINSESKHDALLVLNLSSGLELRLPQSISASRLAEFVHALESRGER